MITSAFVLDILKLTLDFGLADTDYKKLLDQIHFLSIESYEYTGGGVFIGFRHFPGIEEYRINQDKLILNGVEIKSPELDIGAESTLFVKDGLMDYLEIWNYGEVYPETDLKKYLIRQAWEGSEGKQIVSED